MDDPDRDMPLVLTPCLPPPQADPSHGLPNARGAVLSGGVLFSPWLNLRCDTPTYVSQLFWRSQPAGLYLGDVAFGSGTPAASKASFQDNAHKYTGAGLALTHPVASPSFAPRHVLRHLPPVQIHVGMPEVLA